LCAGLADTIARFRASIEDLLRYRGISDPLVAEAVCLIDLHYADPKLRTILRDRLAVTDGTLCEKFKATMGLKTWDHVKKVRLSHGARLLVETTERVKEIARMVGYELSNFDHDFGDQFGLTPREYRQRALPSRLPHPAPLPRRASASPQSLTRAASRVLVIENDQPTLNTTALFLRSQADYLVITTCTGEEGLREAANVTPAAVVVDHQLGEGMTGLEFLHAIRRQHHERQPGVAIITADWDIYDHDEELCELEALVVTKPCDLDELLTVVTYLSAPDFANFRERMNDS
jgi:AraC-like DNA-binding protein